MGHKVELLIDSLRRKYFIIRFNLLNRIDPPPRQRKKELTEKYFERIDPRFGLRFYRMMLGIGPPIDLEKSLKYIEETYKYDKYKKDAKELFILFQEIALKNVENYKKYLIRSELLKSQNS